MFSVDPVSGDLTFISAPDFENPNDAGGNNVYNVIVAVTDGSGGVDTQELLVTVTNINEAPVITSVAAENVTENQTEVLTVSSIDVDGDAPNYSIVSGSDAALFSIDPISGELEFNVAPDFEAPGDADGNNIYEVVVEVADGFGGTDIQAIAVAVTNGNEDPVVTSAASTVAEENQTSVLTVTSADVDGGVPNYSIIGGVDAGLFSIDPLSGELTFSSAPDFESPGDLNSDNVYELVIEVDDGLGGIGTQAIVITVTNVNDEPTLTSTASVSVAENQSDVFVVESMDVDGDSLDYSIVGGVDSALFSIDSSSGALTFDNDQDFESPGDSNSDSVYEVIVQVSDGNGGVVTQTIAVAVTDVNEAPVITGVGGVASGNGSVLTFSVDENQNSLIVVAATDEDEDSVLTYALTGGVDQAAFLINSGTGEISFVTPPNHEEQESYEIELTVTDSGGLMSANNLVINVQDINESPMALPDILEALENEALVIDPIASIIANDSDPEQDVLALVDFTQPENGALVLNAQGNLEYLPNEGFVGQDSFEYIVQDSGGLQVSAQVSLDVRPLSDPIIGAAMPTNNEFEELSTVDTEPETMQIVSQNASAGVITAVDESETTTAISELAESIAENSAEENKEATDVQLIADVFSNTLDSLFIGRNTDSSQPPTSSQQNVERISGALEQILSFEVSSFNINFDIVGYEQNLSPEFRDGILVLRDQIDQLVEESKTSNSPLTTIAPSIVGASLTAGLVTWVLRSGLLLSATITSSPLWRPLDPVPILMQSGEEEDSLFDNDEDGGGLDAQNDQDNLGVNHG